MNIFLSEKAKHSIYLFDKKCSIKNVHVIGRNNAIRYITALLKLLTTQLSASITGIQIVVMPICVLFS